MILHVLYCFVMFLVHRQSQVASCWCRLEVTMIFHLWSNLSAVFGLIEGIFLKSNFRLID